MQTIKDFLAKYSGFTHFIAVFAAACVTAYLTNQTFHDDVYAIYSSFPPLLKELIVLLSIVIPIYRSGLSKQGAQQVALKKEQESNQKGYAVMPALMAMAFLSAMFFCNSSDYHKAVVGGDAASHALGELKNLNYDWFVAGKISSADTIAFAQDISRGTELDDQFLTTVKALHAVNGKDKAALSAAGLQLIGALQKVVDDGSAFIKDPNSKAQADQYFKIISDFVTFLKQQYQIQGGASGSSNSSDNRAGTARKGLDSAVRVKARRRHDHPAVTATQSGYPGLPGQLRSSGESWPAAA